MRRRMKYQGILYRATITTSTEPPWSLEWEPNMFRMFAFVKQVGKHRDDAVSWLVEESNNFGASVTTVAEGTFAL